MTETLPLYLWAAKPHHIEALKAAKASLDLDVLLKPVVAQPGQYGRVLAFGEHPGWFCDSLLVQQDAVGDAILWSLGRITMIHDRGVDKLSRWVGAEVKEITHG